MSEQHPGGTVEGGRCPSCGARVGAAQPWCTLCHARLDAKASATDATDAADLRPGGPVGGSQPSEDPGLPGRPDPAGPATRRDPVAGTPATLPPGAAEAMLAELAATTAGERSLARGPLAGRSRAVRTALAVGAAVVLTALGVGLLTLLGLLL